MSPAMPPKTAAVRHLLPVQAQQRGDRHERQRLKEAVDVLLGRAHLAAAVLGELHVPDRGALVDEPGRRAQCEQRGFTSHSRTSVTGTEISPIISAWISDSRRPLVCSILVLRCITQSATPGTNQAGTSTYMRYLTVTDSTSAGSAETLSTGVSRQACRVSRKRMAPGYLWSVA
jgi:hypothetical protein